MLICGRRGILLAMLQAEDCVRSGEQKHSFWADPVGACYHIYANRATQQKIVAIAHNAKAFHLHFILNRAILLKWKPELIMKGLKIICMKI